MAYSTQNMYQMFDIIPNFIKRMFPLSLKTYPSCTNTMAWDIRDEIRSAYILKMVHQRDNHKPVIDDNAIGRENVNSGGVCSSQPLANDFDLVKPFELFSSTSDRSEQLLCVESINNGEGTNLSQKRKDQKCRTPSQPKTIYHKGYGSSNEEIRSSICEERSTDRTIQLIMESTTCIDSKTNLFNENGENSQIAQKSTVQREYQLLAQKFHQYTINCRATIKALEQKLQKLIDDKHALLHGMVSMRKGQKDVIKKYRKIFNDAMNEHCNEINALLTSYKVIRDNYLALLQQDTTAIRKNRKDGVLSVSYTSYNCC